MFPKININIFIKFYFFKSSRIIIQEVIQNFHPLIYLTAHLLLFLNVHVSVFGRTGSLLLRRLSRAVLSGSALRCTGSSPWGSSRAGNRLWAHEPQQLQRTGLAAPWPVRSYPTRGWTCVPCLGRWIPSHWTTGSPSSSTLALGNWQNLLLSFLAVVKTCCCHFFSCRVGSHPRVGFSRAVAWRLIGDPVKSPKTQLPGKKNFAGSDQACSSPWFFFFK